MEKSLKLTIRTPDQTAFSGEVQSIKVFTERGLIKILPSHASVTGAIDFSPLHFITTNGTEEDYIIRRGTIMISNKEDTVDIMVFSCEKKSEINPTTAKEYLEFIEAELKKGTDLSDFKIKFYEEEKYVIEKQIAHLEK